MRDTFIRSNEKETGGFFGKIRGFLSSLMEKTGLSSSGSSGGFSLVGILVGITGFAAAGLSLWRGKQMLSWLGKMAKCPEAAHVHSQVKVEPEIKTPPEPIVTPELLRPVKLPETEPIIQLEPIIPKEPPVKPIENKLSLEEINRQTIRQSQKYNKEHEIGFDEKILPG